MAIKDPLMFITIEEFKNWKGFNNQLFDEITTPDSEIRYAIEIVSSNIDYLSGFTISKKWPEINPTKFTDNVQTATTHYVNFLLSKGVEYARGQASIGQGGIVYSQNNPEDPYFIPPQVFNYLREINEYLNIKGFNLKGIEPQTNKYFNKFISNYGEDSPLNEYIPYPNIKSLDDRTKITITHPLNMLRPVVNIDTRDIKSIDNLTTENLFQQYFSNDSLQLVDGKQGQKPKVISISDNVPNMLINELTYNTLETENKTISGAINEINKNSGGDSLWEVDKDNPNFIKTKDDKGIDVNGRRIIDVGTPTFLSDATTKEYVDKKQDKLIAGNNITIDENNKISATGGSVDLSDYYKKEDFPKSYFIYDESVGLAPLATYPCSLVNILLYNNNYPDLNTTNKRIINAINELVVRLNNISQWKEVAITTDLLTINYVLKNKTHYRIYLNKYIKDVTEIGINAFVVLYFYYQIDDKPFPINNLEYSNNILKVKQGKLWKLEELQDNSSNYEIISNTLQIISPSNIECNKPLIIKSNSLNTNNPTENTWQIDLKNNPQWKEVAVSLDSDNIIYKLKPNTHYRIFYDIDIRRKSGFGLNPALINYFYWQEKETWEIYIDKNLSNNMSITIIQTNITNKITWTYPYNYGNLWKLEELQE